MTGINTEQIRQRLTHLIKDATRDTLYGVVKEVYPKNRVCRVQIGDIIYNDVLLYSVRDVKKKGYVMIPSTGSTVLVSRIDNSQRYYVSMFSEVDEILFTKDDVTFKVNKEGFTMTKKNLGLKKTLNDLIEAITLLQVPTGTGPSGYPINASKFENIKEEINKYMEG